MADLITKVRKDFDAAIVALEKRRKSRIFVLVQNFDTQHICGPDMRTVLRTRDEFANIDTLEILLHTPGGHASIAYRMARFFRAHCKQLNVIVPLAAKSAGTLLCLGAQRIYMGELAELGPLDVQITDELERGKRPFSPLDEFKSMEFLREYATEFLDYFSIALSERGMSVKQALHEAIPAVTGMMGPLYSHIDPSKVGSYRRSLAEGEEYARRLLAANRNPYTDDLIQQLVWKYPVHDFVIDRQEALEGGLPIMKLDLAQERLLVPALLGMVNNGLSHCGFVALPSGQRAQKRPKKKLPASVKAGNAQAAAAAR